MNRFFIIVFLIFGVTTTNAQIHEIGVFLGGSNFIGDVGATTYIAPDEPAFGILYKWNRSPRHSWRFSYTQSTIRAYDKNSDMPSRVERDYSFKNDIKELAAGLEFDFFDFNLHESTPKVTPFVFTGLSYILYDGLFFANGQARHDSTHSTLAIPITLGIKAKFMENFVIGIESSAKYTFADDLDGSYPKNKNLDNLKFGNINSTDWFVFTGITVTYTFGNKPCYCAE
jgi:hypothetical protein